MRFRSLLAVMLLSFPLAGSARASCGSSSCPIDLHSLLDAGRFSLDLSFQYLDQDRPRIGSRRAQVGEVPSDHDEIRTINRITSLQLSYAVSDRLQLALIAPYVSRSHQHFDRERGQLEHWSFADAGDLALQGRLRLAGDFPSRSSLWVTGGIKLPTGARLETGTGGEEAEVTIAPGSGSTDVVAGLTWETGVLRDTRLEGEMGHTTLIPLFLAITGRVNGRGTHDYRRGDEIQMNAGSEYPLTEALHVIGQINARSMGKDDVGQTQEDRDLTGGRYLYASPGLRVRIARGTSLYGFVQLPLYQHVNGLQLTARANYLMGVRTSF